MNDANSDHPDHSRWFDRFALSEGQRRWLFAVGVSLGWFALIGHIFIGSLPIINAASLTVLAVQAVLLDDYIGRKLAVALLPSIWIVWFATGLINS
jgi:hypothetical protein